MKLLRETIKQGRFVLNLDATRMDSILEKSLTGMVEHGWIDPDHSDAILQALLAREQEAPTAIGHALAIPHAYIQGIDRPLVYFVRLARPVNLEAPG